MARRRPAAPDPEPSWWKFARDALLFLGGLAGVAHETVVMDRVERPFLLAVFASMMGLPKFLEVLERRNGGE
jgi:hypothetical protein